MSSVQAHNLATANPPGVISITDAMFLLDNTLASINTMLISIGVGLTFLSLVFGISVIVLAIKLNKYLRDSVELKTSEHLHSEEMESFIYKRIEEKVTELAAKYFESTSMITSTKSSSNPQITTSTADEEPKEGNI